VLIVVVIVVVVVTRCYAITVGALLRCTSRLLDFTRTLLRALRWCGLVVARCHVTLPRVTVPPRCCVDYVTPLRVLDYHVAHTLHPVLLRLRVVRCYARCVVGFAALLRC